MEKKIAKILKKSRGFYYVLDQNKKILECKAQAKLFRKNKEKIAVGDLVVVDVADFGNWIIKIFERKNKLIRSKINKVQVLFANIDQVFILDSLNNSNPVFTIGCSYAIQKENIKPIVILTKKDLVSKKELNSMNLLCQNANLQFFNHSIYHKTNTVELKKLLVNKSTIFFGKSGVGKSSLINSLFPGMNLKTRILQKNLAGKHTTSNTELYLKKNNILIGDSPGIQEFSFYNLDPEHLSKKFFNFENLVNLCHYKDCKHHLEPKCAIIDAVKNNTYKKELYEIYLILLTKQQV